MSSASLKLGVRVLGRVHRPLLAPRTKVFEIRAAGITGKALRTDDRVRLAPWPYKTKGYNNWHAYLDGTNKRFDDNSKVIFVEGPPATGKTEFAKALAQELEMEYFPMANMDMVYINPYGFDVRSLDPQVPASMRSYDEKRFIREPNSKYSILLQCNLIYLKTDQYMDALAHVFNTGQGVVMDRSPYSDFVFIEAMHKCGYVDKAAKAGYYKLYDAAMKLIMKPHLIVYLDSPVDVVSANLKKRGQGEEKTLTPQFLETMEESYKLKFLRDIETHSELLIYDWSQKGNFEVVVEDIERINFESFDEDVHNPKMQDWRLKKDWDYSEKRWTYTHRKYTELCSLSNVDNMGIPGLIDDLDDRKEYQKVLDKVPGMKYEYGFNTDMGDSVLFKTKALPPILGQRQPYN